MIKNNLYLSSRDEFIKMIRRTLEENMYFQYLFFWCVNFNICTYGPFMSLKKISFSTV